ncbi:TolC family protein [Chryseosolibacter indicus]|uniref:TolC family protein n=1 Tax=Chryseosolibacter indicus TaxID=2782351 RepID=A0ABS5VY93_9BACT|nr:TolC family protein [Chryseosolibacter indicus]MBT1705724.1 TolC family protein [Chryseosolibacter indicus]
MKLKLFAFLMTVILGLTSVYAQEGPAPYSLKQILDIALKNNNSIIKAKYDYEEGAAKTKQVKSAALPQVNINADLTDNVIRQAFVFPRSLGDPNASPDDYIVLRAGMQYSTSVTAQATQQLFNQSVLTGIKAAKASEEFYRNNIVRTEEEVIQQTSTLFYQVASLQAQREVLQSNFDQTNKNLKITSERYENGIARKLDVDRLKVSLTNIQTQLRTIDDNYSNILNQLKLSIGLDVNTPIEISEPLLSDSSTYQLNSTLVANDWNFENKIEYKQLSNQIRLYDLERKNFSAGYFPTLSAYGNYTYNGQSNSFFLSSSANPIWFDIASIGLKLSVPVFDGFNKSAHIQQSKIRRMKVERDLAFTKQQSNMEYLNASKSFETSYASYLAQKENVALANSVYDVTLQNYNEGVSPLTDLLQAESSRIEAQSQLIESLLKVKQAEIALLKAKGEIKNLLN